MNRQHVPQHADVPREYPTGLAHGGNGVPQVPLWLTSREAAAYVGNKSVQAFYEWRKRHGVVPNRMGRVSRRDLDRVLRQPRKRRAMNPASLANLRRRWVEGA